MSTLETERLLLRPFREDDAEKMYQNWTYDERVARYCRWHPHEGVSATQDLLKMYLKQASEGFDYRWAITIKGTDEPIGCIDVVNMSSASKTAEIGYVLSHAYWGQGIMTECFHAVLEKLFHEGFMRIIARHHIDNPASGRVMEKCGMKFCGYGQATEKFGSKKLCRVKCYELKKDMQ